MNISLKKLKPEFWPTVISLACFAVCLALCGWQVKRLYWKEELIKTVEERISAPAVELPKLEDLKDNEFRKVRLEGTVDLEMAMHFGMYYENDWGVKIISPFKLKSGGYIFLNLGWIPEKKRAPELWIMNIPQRPITIDAIIRLGKGKGLFTPENDVRKNYWFWYDFDTMRKITKVNAPDAVFEVVDYKWNGKYPVVPHTNIKFPNDHLQYAITWFLLAIGVAVIYVVYTIQRSKEVESSLPET